MSALPDKIALTANFRDPIQPTLQRFLSWDPIGLTGGPNLYTYCNNNPSLFVDPSGLQVQGKDVAVGIAIGVAGVMVGGLVGTGAVLLLGEETAAAFLIPASAAGGWDIGKKLYQGFTGKDYWTFQKLPPGQQGRNLGEAGVGLITIGLGTKLYFGKRAQMIKLSEVPEFEAENFLTDCDKLQALKVVLAQRYGYNPKKISIRLYNGRNASSRNAGAVFSERGAKILTENDGRIIVGLSPRFLELPPQAAATVLAHEKGHLMGLKVLGELFPESVAQAAELLFRVPRGIDYYP